MNVYVELATMVMVYSVNHMSRQCAPLSIRLVSAVCADRMKNAESTVTVCTVLMWDSIVAFVCLHIEVMAHNAFTMKRQVISTF
ncbi:unnamed protein product [Toxocara canis]|uniref:Secreted protein n=1 Tax=Toxocara canis TaxID=6265 RepID=A0A183U8C2_TOXCA|nr:unnamed protein product [Toxocara canis]